MAQLRQVARWEWRRYFKNKNCNDTSWQQYVSSHKRFNKAVRQAKRYSWKIFTEEWSIPKEITRLTKIIQVREDTQIGILKDGDGVDPKDSLNKLLNAHFPGSVEVTMPEAEQGDLDNWGHRLQEVLCSGHFITQELVCRAINTFGNAKAAGLDGFKPIVLKHLPDNYIKALRILFVCSLQTGYVPKRWHQSKVTFIPKLGKADYSRAKAFRPITLSSFIFKAMERIILNFLKSKIDIYGKLRKDQHAFWKESSCDLALSLMVNELEQRVQNNQYMLAIFLDIAGAFNNLKLESCIRVMQCKGIPPKVVMWYSHYLHHCMIETEVKGLKRYRCQKKGTPQGGILSPLAWNLAFDEILDTYDRGPVKAKVFVDNAPLVITGPALNTLVWIGQEAVEQALAFGTRNGLTFGASKTEAVIFTQKRLELTLYPNLRWDTM